MHNKEIELFIEGIKLAKDEFYVDAMTTFQELVKDYPDSDLADDALFNIGLCNYHMNQFSTSIDVLNKMIKSYPDATITALENSVEFGKTAAKAHYLIIQCYLGLNNISNAKNSLTDLKAFNDDTYIKTDTEKVTFYELAEKAITTYLNL